MGDEEEAAAAAVVDALEGEKCIKLLLLRRHLCLTKRPLYLKSRGGGRRIWSKSRVTRVPRIGEYFISNVLIPPTLLIPILELFHLLLPLPSFHFPLQQQEFNWDPNHVAFSFSWGNSSSSPKVWNCHYFLAKSCHSVSVWHIFRLGFVWHLRNRANNVGFKNCVWLWPHSYIFFYFFGRLGFTRWSLLHGMREKRPYVRVVHRHLRIEAFQRFTEVQFLTSMILLENSIHSTKPMSLIFYVTT